MLYQKLCWGLRSLRCFGDSRKFLSWISDTLHSFTHLYKVAMKPRRVTRYYFVSKVLFTDYWVSPEINIASFPHIVQIIWLFKITMVNFKIIDIFTSRVFTAVASLSIEHAPKNIFLYNNLSYLFSLIPSMQMQVWSVFSGTRSIFFLPIPGLSN